MMFNRENARMNKWKDMIPNLRSMMMNGDEKLKARVRKGIPKSLRHEVWPLICNIKGMKTSSNMFYDELIAKENWIFEADIKKDVDLTFQNNIFFSREVGKVGSSDTESDHGYPEGRKHRVSAARVHAGHEFHRRHVLSVHEQRRELLDVRLPVRKARHVDILQGARDDRPVLVHLHGAAQEVYGQVACTPRTLV